VNFGKDKKMRKLIILSTLLIAALCLNSYAGDIFQEPAFTDIEPALTELELSLTESAEPLEPVIAEESIIFNNAPFDEMADVEINGAFVQRDIADRIQEIIINEQDIENQVQRARPAYDESRGRLRDQRINMLPRQDLSIETRGGLLPTERMQRIEQARRPRNQMIMLDDKEFMDWLKDVYPQEFERLQELKETNPQLYELKLLAKSNELRRLYFAYKENPERGEILIDIRELNQQRDIILKELKNTNDEKELEELKEKLAETIEKKYDLLVKQKELAYQSLRERLEKLQQQVKESEKQVGKWKSDDYRGKLVAERLATLTGDDSKVFNWD